MVQLVGDNKVLFAERRRHRARVGRESGLKDYASLDVLEVCDFFLQLQVNFHGAGDGSHRTRSDAVLTRSLERRLAQLGMGGQAQIIIRGEVNDSHTVEAADRSLLVVDHPQAKVRASGLEIVELIGEIRKRISAGGTLCRHSESSLIPLSVSGGCRKKPSASSPLQLLPPSIPGQFVWHRQRAILPSLCSTFPFSSGLVHYLVSQASPMSR